MSPHFPLPSQAGISLGSNLGESDLILRNAIAQLQKLHSGHPSTFLLSSFYNTAPVNCPIGSPNFLNAVVQLETSLSSNQLIEFLQELEAAEGRPLPRIKNSPRRLDLDLLYHGTSALTTDFLILPHPKILEREFVLKPLSEIAPNLTLPGWDKTAEEYLLNLENNLPICLK